MKKIMVVVDIQKDFVDGALGSKDSVAMIPAAAKRIKDFDGEIFATYDTHFENYMETAEGKKLPVPHCIKGTDGWELNDEIEKALEGKKVVRVEKNTFGSTKLPKLIENAVGNEDFTIEIFGLCTDICLISNVLILKAYFPEKKIMVYKDSCAGVTAENHNAALLTMQSCHIDVI